MKRIISTILVCVLLLGCVLTLASCGKKLRGTYVCEEDGASISYTFKGKKFTAEMKWGDTVVDDIEGTYKIDGDKITFTYEVDGEEVEEECDFEKGKGYIEIDGDKYEKQ